MEAKAHDIHLPIKSEIDKY